MHLPTIDFMKEAISENLLAGNAMSRRALYMSGMGKSLATGENSLIALAYIVN
ncbi:hypothetical protein IV511_07320 [Enterobacter quasihormaechei]|uniref:hypothetical protein n=1 Tax=Enterobacter quasihormaechei TaxID=2529382 RepID=UPI002F403B1A